MVQCLEDAAEFYDQSVPEVSPPAWNLGHTTWFFDAIVLARYAGSIGEGDARFWYHFNSYYKGAGAHVRQACRGTVLIDDIPVITRSSKVSNPLSANDACGKLEKFYTATCDITKKKGRERKLTTFL
tara:strand:- start:371 stop:751 length:381 start_codon:yes stop_codon:yes gene_type:complete